MDCQQSPEYETLIQSTDDLTTALSNDLTNIAGKLLARRMIPESVHDTVTGSRSPGLTRRDKASRLIICIRDRVKITPEAFSTFMEVLQGELHLENTVKQLSDRLKSFSKSLHKSDSSLYSTLSRHMIKTNT